MFYFFKWQMWTFKNGFVFMAKAQQLRTLISFLPFSNKITIVNFDKTKHNKTSQKLFIKYGKWTLARLARLSFIIIQILVHLIYKNDIQKYINTHFIFILCTKFNNTKFIGLYINMMLLP